MSYQQSIYNISIDPRRADSALVIPFVEGKDSVAQAHVLIFKALGVALDPTILSYTDHVEQWLSYAVAKLDRLPAELATMLAGDFLQDHIKIVNAIQVGDLATADIFNPALIRNATVTHPDSFVAPAFATLSTGANVLIKMVDRVAGLFASVFAAVLAGVQNNFTPALTSINDLGRVVRSADRTLLDQLIRDIGVIGNGLRSTVHAGLDALVAVSSEITANTKELQALIDKEANHVAGVTTMVVSRGYLEFINDKDPGVQTLMNTVLNKPKIDYVALDVAFKNP